MAPRSRSWQNLCNNLLANPTREQDVLANPQSLVKRSDAGSNEAFIPLEALILSLVLLTKDLFTKFMKAFVESTQAWDREQAKPWERSLKARFLKTDSEKSYIDYYYFCQQYKDHFEFSGAIGIDHTPFTASFLHGTISLR